MAELAAAGNGAFTTASAGVYTHGADRRLVGLFLAGGVLGRVLLAFGWLERFRTAGFGRALPCVRLVGLAQAEGLPT
jgi:hypothetical protein